MSPYASGKRWTLYAGDALEVLPSVCPRPGVILTDPPYGIAYRSGQQRRTLARSIVGDESTEGRDAVLALYPDTPALVFGTRRVATPAGTRMVLVWDKGGALGMGALDLPWKPGHEEVYVLGHGFHGHRGNDVIRHPPVQSIAANGRQHPHEKPVALLASLLAKCPPGLVLDPFAGVMSSGVAALLGGREFVGVEIDPQYLDIGARRLAQAEANGVQSPLFGAA